VVYHNVMRTSKARGLLGRRPSDETATRNAPSRAVCLDCRRRPATRPKAKFASSHGSRRQEHRTFDVLLLMLARCWSDDAGILQTD
jgi:hypothetical protein